MADTAGSMERGEILENEDVYDSAAEEHHPLVDEVDASDDLEQHEQHDEHVEQHTGDVGQDKYVDESNFETVEQDFERINEDEDPKVEGYDVAENMVDNVEHEKEPEVIIPPKEETVETLKETNSREIQVDDVAESDVVESDIVESADEVVESDGKSREIAQESIQEYVAGNKSPDQSGSLAEEEPIVVTSTSPDPKKATKKEKKSFLFKIGSHARTNPGK